MISYSLDELTKIKKYFLDLFYEEEKNIIRGELDICAQYKNIGCNNIDKWIIESCDSSTDDFVKDAYSIEIDFNKTDRFNNAFPKVFETDKRIENLSISLNKSLNDLHLNNDKSCCLGLFAPYDCLSFDDFVIKRVYPYFVWQAYFSKYKKVPPCGELPHDWQKASEIRAIDEENGLELLRSKQKGKPTGNNRNKLCPCSSGKKYKRCCLRFDKETNDDIIKTETSLSYFKKQAKEKGKGKTR